MEKNKAACSMQFSCGVQQFFRSTTAAAVATVPPTTARWVAHETRAICVAPRWLQGGLLNFSAFDAKLPKVLLPLLGVTWRV